MVADSENFNSVFGTWEAQLGKFRLKSALVLAVFFVAACSSGDDAAMRQAIQQCQARGLDAASAAYDACVHQISEAIYVSWGRDIPSQGD